MQNIEQDHRVKFPRLHPIATLHNVAHFGLDISEAFLFSSEAAAFHHLRVDVKSVQFAHAAS
eukprot:CAMPEP_0170578868 /NCGR_PEP_ID=MMETSP0224-20130122/5683_1 /TAXON_ID=285029 /ORGANISM="Togula jolla, Strain CCCM 725" /LENGTH=61 /DNA_ID=CAMNT_0010901861 /DNA_START=229 /DNA_END=414 /DNA_ORIENTATION=+